MVRADAGIVFGRRIEQRGWYVLFNLTFVRKMHSHLNLHTWQPMYSKCYYRVIFNITHPSKANRWLTVGTWWSPLTQ